MRITMRSTNGPLDASIWIRKRWSGIWRFRSGLWIVGNTEDFEDAMTQQTKLAPEIPVLEDEPEQEERSYR